MRLTLSLLSLSLLLAACAAPTGGQVLSDMPLPPPEPALAFPPLLDLAESVITLSDYESGWRRYTTPGGQLSFLYPPSWEVDDGEWTITRTVFVGTKEEAPHPVDVLLTVHGIGEVPQSDAVAEQVEQIRINPLTNRLLQAPTGLLDPSAAAQGSGSTVAVYRTTIDPGRSFLHLIVPRRQSLLTIETPSTALATAYPLRVVLESVRFRD